LWVRKAGAGYSSLIAWQGRVATQWQTLAGQFVVCLDANSGKTLWRYRYDWPYLPGSVYPGPRSSPTYWKGRVLFAAPDGLVGCLDAKSGKEVWSTNLKERFQGQGTDFGCSASPVVVGGKVVLPVGGHGASIVALDAVSGEVVWRAGDDPASYASVLPITYQGRRLLVGYLQNSLVCHDLETGEVVWRRPLSRGYDEHSSWPIYREPYLWVASAFRGGSELLEIAGTEEEKLELRPVWSSQLLSNDILSSVLVGEAIYGFDVSDAQAKTHRPTRGSFRCLSFREGKELWATSSERRSRRLAQAGSVPGQSVGHACVLYADDKLVLLNDTGELILARATEAGYSELGRTRILGGEICWTQPILYRNRIYARNQSRIICVYLGRADQLDARVLETAIPATELPQPQYVDLTAMLLGVEPEYAFDIPSRQWLINWFFTAWPGILGVSWGLAYATCQFPRLRTGGNAARRLSWSLAFVLGAIGTPLLSRWCNDFVFTWPVCVFVTFHATVHQLYRVQNESGRRISWRARLVGLGFLASCLAYFLICRRLSLVFEWVFLCGFPAALPLSLAAAFLFRQRRWYGAWELLMSSAAFAAFYWSSVGVLAWKAA
jgi:outer membrane protein assembly factor BamB